MPETPVLICFDGSDHAKAAIAEAAELIKPRPAIVLAVWPSALALPAFSWTSAGTGIDYVGLDRESTEAAERVAMEGVEIARAAGLDAKGLAARSGGPIWETIVEVANQQNVALIVLGARGLSRMQSVLLGSVSEGVTRHAQQPTLVVRDRDEP